MVSRKKSVASAAFSASVHKNSRNVKIDQIASTCAPSDDTFQRLNVCVFPHPRRCSIAVKTSIDSRTGIRAQTESQPRQLSLPGG